MDALPTRLRELRTKSGRTQEDVSQILNIAQSTLANYECGRRTPSFSMLIQIADFYHVSLDYMAGLASE